jgi:uncharacterized protein YegJ (DUF2314 family)
MRSAGSWLVLALCLGICACDSSGKPDTLVSEGYDQAAMEAAIKRAQAEVDFFIDALDQKTGSDFGVKAPIEENGQTEHFWLTDLTFQNGEFSGKIGNDPGIVKNVKFGQDWKIKKEAISDWMFMRDGKMHGNYTMRPLLTTLPKEEEDAYRAMFAKP